MRSLPEDKLLHRSTSPAALRAQRNRPVLEAMLRLMPADQRRLAEMVLLNHVSHRAAAVSLRMSAGAVTRRVHSLQNRLACPVRRALAQHLDTLPDPTRAIAVEYFFGRSSRAAVAKTFGLTLREVDQHVEYVRGWIRALNRRRRAELARRAALLDQPFAVAS